VTEIQCNGTNLPNFPNAHTVTSHIGVFPYAHDVIYSCVIGGYRFEDGDAVTTVTCSFTGWAWNPIVTSCGRMLKLLMLFLTTTACLKSLKIMYYLGP